MKANDTRQVQCVAAIKFLRYVFDVEGERQKMQKVWDEERDVVTRQKGVRHE